MRTAGGDRRRQRGGALNLSRICNRAASNSAFFRPGMLVGRGGSYIPGHEYRIASSVRALVPVVGLAAECLELASAPPIHPNPPAFTRPDLFKGEDEPVGHAAMNAPVQDDASGQGAGPGRAEPERVIHHIRQTADGDLVILQGFLTMGNRNVGNLVALRVGDREEVWPVGEWLALALATRVPGQARSEI